MLHILSGKLVKILENRNCCADETEGSFNSLLSPRGQY